MVNTDQDTKIEELTSVLKEITDSLILYYPKVVVLFGSAARYLKGDEDEPFPNDIDLIDLDADAEASGFYKKYPYFGKLAVPAGTYKGVNHDAPGFQDSALWVANSKVSADTVYKLLSLIYTDAGLKHMVSMKKTFKNMNLKTGPSNIVTPFHPGAEKFWREKGVLK